MPILPWRNDADGFAFENSWTFDSTERAALTGIAQSVVPLVVAGLAATLPPDPVLLTAILVAANAAVAYPAAGPLPTYGMCGGMAYACLDYWHARAILPRGANSSDQPERTAAAGPIRSMIWDRLLNSLGPGGVLRRTLEWSLLLNQVPTWVGGGAVALLNRTKQEWDTLKRHIDAGQPWPIGLIYTGRDIWFQHQIMVHGYEDTGIGTGRLYVYDNNSPSEYGDKTLREIPLDFTGSALVATTPSDFGDMLAGFFCSDYIPVAPPPGLAQGFGEFLSFSGDPRTWMVVDGARMAIANGAELAALGAAAADVRATGQAFTPGVVRPRDGALFRERSDPRVYLYQGGAPFWVPDPTWLSRFGGWDATRVVPDNTIGAFAGFPDEGTLLREWSDPKVYRIMAGTRRWVTSPAELQKYSGFPTVRVVPDGALNSIPVGPILPTPDPGECAALRTQISELDRTIAGISRLLDRVDNPRRESALRNALQTAQRQRNEALARATLLQCPA